MIDFGKRNHYDFRTGGGYNDGKQSRGRFELTQLIY